MTLTTHHIEFTATVLTPLHLDDQAGASIRGAVVGGLWERFCANKAAPTCADCPLIPVCPVAELIAPMRAEGEIGGAQRPRPYVLRPPAEPTRHYAPDLGTVSVWCEVLLAGVKRGVIWLAARELGATFARERDSAFPLGIDSLVVLPLLIWLEESHDWCDTRPI